MKCEKVIGCLSKIAAHHRHPQNNPMYAHGCLPCFEDECEDIQSSTYEFEVTEKPVQVYGICNVTGNYKIFREEENCEEGKSWDSVSANSPALIKAKGKYEVRYEWDNCCEGEPDFAHVEMVCC